MKNIIWKDLIQNIIRCIIAYPLFLIAFVISIPLNIIGWFGWIVELVTAFVKLVTAFVQFIFIGSSFIKYSTIGYLITDFSFEYLMFVLFPVTWWIYERINDFNDTLYPIKRSYSLSEKDENNN